jgi:hypothetical protein
MFSRRELQIEEANSAHSDYQACIENMCALIAEITVTFEYV